MPHDNNFRLLVSGKEIQIPLSPIAMTNFLNQFPNRTGPQKARLKTLYKVVEAAYRKGLEIGKASNA